MNKVEEIKLALSASKLGPMYKADFDAKAPEYIAWLLKEDQGLQEDIMVLKDMVHTKKKENERLRKELEEVRKSYINRELLTDYLKGLYMNKRRDYYKARNMHASHDAEIQMRLLSEIQSHFEEKPYFDYVKYMRSLGQEGEGN